MTALWWRLVKFGFRLLYNEFAFTYDWVSIVVSLGAWRCWQRTALKHLRVPTEATILEVAHGTGNLQLDLNGLGYRTMGYDLSAQMGRITGGKLRRAGLPVRLARGRAESLPYASESFAAVISTFPTNFIVAPETLREIYRVLQPDGQLLIVPNGVLCGEGLAEASLEWLYRITGQREGGPQDLSGFFADYGFEVELRVERCPRSAATVIVGRKSRSGNSAFA